MKVTLPSKCNRHNYQFDEIYLLNLKNMASKPNEEQSSQSNDDLPSGQLIGSQYVKSYSRISKDSLYMILALWMENFVKESPEDHNQVGAVLVLPSDVVYAADCSRDGVHAVARLLINHHDKAEGSKMFMSRKPCAMCAKLLVQSKVKRVLFLPFEPEYYRVAEEGSENETIDRVEKFNSQMKQVDSLFTASPIAQTRFVLKVEEPVLKDAERKTSSQKMDVDQRQIDEEKRRLNETIGFGKRAKWRKSIKDDLPWPEFDKEMHSEVIRYFDNAMEWVARAKVIPGRGLKYEFERCSALDSNESGDGNGNKSSDGVKSGNSVPKVFDPVNNGDHKKQAGHFITMARFLSERTDDPKTGVGAVIVSYPGMEILGLGWNGYPLKALYGEFARASKDDSIEGKKYPYIIHAEQNALLMRNTQNIKNKNAILFVTKSPCNECTPLIAMQGIKTVVVDDDKDVLSRGNATQPNALSYKAFPDRVKKGEFVCFQTKELPKGQRGVSIKKRSN